MIWKGVILKESIEDDSLLRLINIIEIKKKIGII